MAKGFNLTAQINLQGPSNLKPVVAQIRRELGTVSANVDVKLNAQSARSIDSVSAKLKSMNAVLAAARDNTITLNKAMQQLSGTLNNAGSVNNKVSVSMTNTAANAQAISKNIKQATTEMQEFGKQGALAIRRFAAFSVVTNVVFKVINAINSAFTSFVTFDRELVKLQQVTGKSEIGLKQLQAQITNLATSLGVSSESLTTVASTLAQAGLNAEETRIALAALAKTELAPSFDNLTDTTEGAIAALRQFGLQAKDLEAALGSINAVAAAFAVESRDIIVAIQRTGGVFASASKGVSEGKDALNEFISVFTSVRATTRESAETIATGLRTIFTRIQRKGTIEALKEYGVVLTDLEGKFVGPYEATRRLSEGLKQLDPRDLRFTQIVEELGGFRQIGKVIPLIQQFAEAQKALKVAQTGQSSLTDAQLTAQKSLANQIAKVREQFLALFRDIGQSTTFKAITTIVLGLTSAFISLASAFKPILPFLAILATIKGVKALGEFGTGFFGGITKGGGAGATGKNIGESLSGAKEKQTSEATAKAADAIRLNTDALRGLTSTVNSLENTIRSRGATTLNGGGKVMGFARGGLVPGSGNRDTVPAKLMPGEFVIRKKAVEKLGAGNLHQINKYALGGKVELTGKKLKNTYRSLSGIVDNNQKYAANIQPIPVDDNDILKDMRRRKQKSPTIPNWKNFEIAVGKKYGLSIAGGNKFLDYPSKPGEAKFLRPDEGYARDQETGFIKGNNNETMLAKLIGAGLYRPNKRIYTYYPKSLSKFSKLSLGGLVQKFKEGGTAEPLTAEEIYEWVTELGTAQTVRGLVGGNDRINQVLGSISSTGKPVTSKEIFSKNFLLSNRSGPYLSAIEGLLEVAESTKKRARIFTEEEKASATKVGLVGMFPFDIDTKHYEDIAGRILEINTKSLPKSKAEEIYRIRQEIDEALGRGTQALYGRSPLSLDDPTKEALGLGNLEGYMIEAILAKAGANPGRLDDRSVDYASGLGSAASLFGIDPAIPTEVKRDVKGGLSKARANFRNYFAKFAIGGSVQDTVPALLTPGEFVVNKNAAKRIGYSRLHKLNQADKIGVKGYNKGGVVGGIQRFEDGGNVGRLSKEERKRRKEAYTARSRGDITREEARAVGAPRPDFGAGASRKRDVMARPQGAENIAKIEAEVISNYRKLYKEQKQKIDEFYNNLEEQASQEFFEGKISSDELNDIFTNIISARILKKSQAKETLTAESKAASQKAVQDYVVGRQTPQIEERKATDTKAFDTQIQSAMAVVAKEAKAKYQQLYNEESQSLKAFYSERYKQVKSEGGDVSAVIAEYRAAVADAKQSLESGLKTEVAQKQAAVPEQIAEQKKAQVAQFRSDKARATDPFYDAKQAADLQREQAKTSPFGMGPEDPDAKKKRQQAFADEQYYRYKAEQQGTSVQAVKLAQAQQLGKASFQNKEFYRGKLTETQASLATRRDTAMKIGGSIKEAEAQLAAAPAGSAEAVAAATRLADAQSRLAMEQEGILQQMVALRPDLAATQEGMNQLAAGAKTAADALAAGDLEAAQQALSDKLGETITAAEAMEISMQNFAKETNQDIEMVRRQFGQGAGAKMVERQQFIQSREGQRMGLFAQLAPDLAKKAAGTKLGQALGGATDFAQGKGGILSQTFAKAGGFRGVGASVAIGANVLKQALPKSMAADPNTAGALGALSGAGSGAAAGAQLLSGLPFGEVIGGIGGAIIGGIQGFFNAKNQAIITNALENIAKSSGDLDTAFKQLESSFTSSNLANAQKAFGEVLTAQNELESMSFGSYMTGENAVNVGGTALAGAATGAAIGSMIPVIGTAIGAAIGGIAAGGYAAYGVYGNKQEALKARIGQSEGNIKAATRFAEVQGKQTSTEDLGKIYDSLKAGSNELNPLVKAYQDGAIKAAEANGRLTEKQKEGIRARESERAALDAYVQKRKQSGASDEQIQKELEKDRAAALKEGNEKLRIDAELLAKQQLLARATKEVALATESLLDVYRRVTAKAQRFSDEIGDMLNINQATINSLSGKSEVSKVDRRGAERVLGNISAYSPQEVQAATQEMVGKLGGGTEAQALGKQAEAAKFLQDKLPAMLRAPDADAGKIMDTLRSQFQGMGLNSDAINQMLKDVEVQLGADREGGLGTLASEIEKGGIDQISSTAQEALKTMQNLAKTYNDALQQSIDLQNQYNESIMQADEYLRKAGSIRLTAELDLARALGRSPTLRELNQPFDFEIKDLTKRLIPGGTTDPTEIANGIIAATRQNTQLEAANVALGTTGMQGAVGANSGAELLKEQQANIAAIGANNVAINQSRQALERLANDGTKAANALSKIQEEQQALEGFAAFAQNVFTAEPQQLAKMEIEAAALNAAQAAGPEFMQSRFNRQQAFAGLEQAKGFLTPQEFKDIQADLTRKSFEAQGFKGGDVVKKIGGKEFTLDQLIERMKGGVSELDPNVVAYREAVDTQIKANEELKRLEEIKSLQIQEAMTGLVTFLANEFPRILAEAVKESRADAATQPETGAAPTEAQKNQAAANKKYEEAGKKKQQIDAKIATEEKKLKEAESKVGWEQGASTEVARRKRKIRELQEQSDQEQKNMDEAKSEFVASSSTVAEEEKTRQEAKAAQAAEEKKAREAKATEAKKQSEAARMGNRPTVIQAPPAPGTAAATVTRPQTQANTQPQTYGTTVSSVPMVSLDTLERSRADKQAEIIKKEKTLKAAKIAAYAAGTTETSPTLAAAQASFDSAKQDLASINEQITVEKQRLAAIEQQAAIAQQSQQQQSEQLNPYASGDAQLSAQMSSGVDPNHPFVQRLRQPETPQPVPVPSNLPQPVEYTRQVQTAETGGTAVNVTNGEATNTMTTGQLLTLDPASLKGLNDFNTTFGSYVDKLVGFQFPVIPDKIELNHNVQIDMTGAASITTLEKRLQELAVALVMPKIEELRNETSAATEGRVKGSGAKGVSK
jgi:hypothetical protein